MTTSRAFLKGFLVGLFVMILINILAAHLLSDCGLPAILGASPCADDIVRAGFPLVFFEQGGFAFRSIFNLPYLLLDILFGIGLAVLSGFSAQGLSSRRNK
ncbi:MAG: hypothetical protein HZB50_04490 [Chloroflexi bacterium]|nr:hypothetical protein [Chloroflexota bacterium]